MTTRVSAERAGAAGHAGTDACPDAEVLDAHGIRVVVAPDGGRIASIRAHGVELLARTPWADELDDAWSMTASSAEWHRRYRGGWHVLVPAAGDPSPDAVVEQPFHGEAAWRTWRLEHRVDAVVARVLLRTLPLHVERSVSIAPGRVTVETRVRNEGPDEAPIVWVEHPAFAGALFDDADVRLGDAAVPIVTAPGGEFADVDGAAGAVEVQSRSAGLDLRMTWDADLLPRLYVWQERRGSTGFPWWGAVDAVGIEPASDAYGTATAGTGSVRIAADAEIVSTVVLEIRPRR
ncbi:hypothetical protein [uncultured Microbacterium sp.]|uniref:hypothetical protein n=1 Tax=uncultured Microbacterium sp. TaxID=191216 RepID=UPI0028DC2817|nr:hypothetical protein [uncultured Microbacterium sp.]